MTDLESLTSRIKELEHTVNGNGQPGIAEDVRNIKREIESMQRFQRWLMTAIAGCASIGGLSPHLDWVLQLVRSL